MPTFQMEFHLPFFALRKLSQSEKHRSTDLRRPIRLFEDFTLLSEANDQGSSQEMHRLYHGQVSCVVYGNDEWQWTAYSFVDTEHDDDTDITIDGEIGSQHEIDEDPITGDVQAGHFHIHIWRPRQYFLKAFAAQIQQPRRECDDLVHQLVVDITECVSEKLHFQIICKLHPLFSGELMRNRNLLIIWRALTLLEAPRKDLRR
jgi:hypothetical protein